MEQRICVQCVCICMLVYVFVRLSVFPGWHVVMRQAEEGNRQSLMLYSRKTYHPLEDPAPLSPQSGVLAY